MCEAHKRKKIKRWQISKIRQWFHKTDCTHIRRLNSSLLKYHMKTSLNKFFFYFVKHSTCESKVSSYAADTRVIFIFIHVNSISTKIQKHVSFDLIYQTVIVYVDGKCEENFQTPYSTVVR